MSPDRKRISRRKFLQMAGATGAAGLAGTWSLRSARAAPGVTGTTIELTAAMPDWLQPGSSDTLKKIKAAFEAANRNVVVREVAIPFGQFHDQMLTRLEAGNPPDVLRADDPQLPLYIERGYLEPLDSRLQDAGLDPSAFISSQRAAQRGNRTYAVAFITNPRAFIYNRALFDEAGLGAPKNVAEFQDAMRRITRPDRQQFGFGLATKAGDTTGMFIQLMPVIIGMGGNFFREGRPTATDPNVLAALRLVKSLWDNNQIPRGLDAVSTNTLMYQAKVASLVSGAFIVFQARASNPAVGRDLDTAPSPFPSPVGMHASAFWVVPKAAKNKDLAFRYIIQMLQPEMQRAIVEDQGAFPARRGMLTPDYVRRNPWFKVFFDVSRDTISYLPPGTGSKGFGALKIIAEHVEQILYQNKPVEAAMGDLQKALEAMSR